MTALAADGAQAQEHKSKLEASLLEVGRTEIREMKGYTNPPEHVRLTWNTVLVLLGLIPSVTQKVAWSDLKKVGYPACDCQA